VLGLQQGQAESIIRPDGQRQTLRIALTTIPADAARPG
jgi:hypothetical protein